MKSMKYNFSFLISTLGILFIFSNFSTSRENSQIKEYLKESLKKAFLNNVVLIDNIPKIDSNSLIIEYSYLVRQKYETAEISQIYDNDIYMPYVDSVKEIIEIDNVKYEIGYGIKKK